MSVGRNILTRLLSTDTIDFMRMSVAEARRFPDLADAGRMARERGAQAVAQALGALAQGDKIGSSSAFAPDRLAATARFFLDLVVTPLLLRAVSGEDPKQLRAEIDEHVPHAVAFFLAACRPGAVDA